MKGRHSKQVPHEIKLFRASLGDASVASVLRRTKKGWPYVTLSTASRPHVSVQFRHPRHGTDEAHHAPWVVFVPSRDSPTGQDRLRFPEMEEVLAFCDVGPPDPRAAEAASKLTPEERTRPLIDEITELSYRASTPRL